MVYSGLRLLLGVSSSIAAYRALDIASTIVKGGGEVHAVLTPNTTNLVGTAAFDAITGKRTITTLWGSDHSGEMDHLALTKWANVMCVAPATAGTLARLALGLADDALGTLALAWPQRMIIAPAMNPTMYANAVVRHNIELLRQRGHRIVEPACGPTACGDQGQGRLADVSEIVNGIVEMLRECRHAADLSGHRILITSGPTREFADPVRCITNPSTGRMGVALARQAIAAGAEVILVTGPCDLPMPSGLKMVERVVTADEMRDAVLKHLPGVNAAIFAAAVSDWKPAQRQEQKAKKEDGPSAMTLQLVRTPDVAGEANRHRKAHQVFVGFAAETEEIVGHARDKMRRKGFDLVVANPVNVAGSGFGSDTNQATLISANNDRELPQMTKDELAIEILSELSVMLNEAKREDSYPLSLSDA